MSAPQDPIHQLEPSNLLEPLDLMDAHSDDANSTAGSDRDRPSPAASRTSAREAMPRSDRQRGGLLKPALIVGCAALSFAAGALLSRTLPLDIVTSSGTVGSATRVSAPPAPNPVESHQSKLAQMKADEPGPPLESSSPPAAEKPSEPEIAALPGATRGRWTDPVPDPVAESAARPCAAGCR